MPNIKINTKAFWREKTHANNTRSYREDIIFHVSIILEIACFLPAGVQKLF